MIDSVSIYKILKISKVWDMEDSLEPESVEIYLTEDTVVLSRYKEDGVLIFNFEEWEAVNKFIKEEIEKSDAQT